MGAKVDNTFDSQESKGNTENRIIGFCEDSNTSRKYLKILVRGLPVFIPISRRSKIKYKTVIRLFRDIGFYNYKDRLIPTVEFPDDRDLRYHMENRRIYIGENWYPIDTNVKNCEFSSIDKKVRRELEYLSLYVSDSVNRKLSNPEVCITKSCVKITGTSFGKELDWNIDIESAYDRIGTVNRENLCQSELYVLHQTDAPQYVECIGTDSTNEWLLLTDDQYESLQRSGVNKDSHLTKSYLLILLFFILDIVIHVTIGYSYMMIY